MIVVTDTSIVLNLAWLRLESLLASLFGQVLAPTEVRREFERLASADPRFAALSFPPFVEVREPTTVRPDLASNAALDPGERAAIALALEVHPDAVLVDETAGRRVAKGLGLRPVGLLGILLEGKRRGLIPAVTPLLEALDQRAHFRIHDDLRSFILREAGELPGCVDPAE